MLLGAVISLALVCCAHVSQLGSDNDANILTGAVFVVGDKQKISSFSNLVRLIQSYSTFDDLLIIGSAQILPFKFVRM